MNALLPPAPAPSAPVPCGTVQRGPPPAKALSALATAAVLASRGDKLAGSRCWTRNSDPYIARRARASLFDTRVEESRLEPLDDHGAARAKALHGCLLHVQSELEARMYPDGIWLQHGGYVDGSALHSSGIPAKSSGTLQSQAKEVLLWFACREWPYAVMTMAIGLGEGRFSIAGECSRTLLPDARRLQEEAVALNPGDIVEKNGLVWKRFPDSCSASGETCAVVSVTVLGSQFASLVPIEQDERQTQPPLPTAETVISFFTATFGSKVRGIRGRLEDLGGAKPPVADRKLFELLGVDPDATAGTLRRAWRRRARRLHPDASPDEAAAFAALKEAFEVLSEPTQRVRYEALGAAGLQEFEASLEGFTTALSLVLGAWALRPLLGAVDSPLGLGAAASKMEAPPEGVAQPSPVEAVMSALDAELRLILDWPEATNPVLGLKVDFRQRRVSDFVVLDLWARTELRVGSEFYEEVAKKAETYSDAPLHADAHDDGQLELFGLFKVFSKQSDLPADLGTVRAASASFHHICAIRSDGQLTCFGKYDLGQCDVPEDLGPVLEVAVGYAHTCALRADRQVICFGYNVQGSCEVPNDLGEVQSLCAGTFHTCVITVEGKLVCFGDNEHGQCDVPNLGRPILGVSAGFGSNRFGQCDVPEDLGSVLSVAAGDSHTCAIKATGELVCFGKNDDGRCDVPSDLGAVLAVAAGYSHTCAIRTDGQLSCFGDNECGQCDVPPNFGTLLVN
ncbi:dnaJ [Symbiodinium sp. CCMP2592]|nr:dnaJ [Symbiodinium sp. CCMP2592]